MTKIAQKQQAQDILKRYNFSQKLEGVDLAFMLTLLRQHPRAAEKIGCGVATIALRPHPIYRTKTMWLIRTDGTEIDFSYQKCLDGEANAMTIFLAAARLAVSESMFRFKMAYFAGAETALCQASGIPITFHAAHVDHLPPVFDDIARAFLSECGQDVNTIAYVDGIGKTFADPEFTAQWRAFHDARAHLRVIEAKLNMALGKHKPAVAI